MSGPTIAEFEKHALRYGVALVHGTAAANGFSESELSWLRLRLLEIEQQQPKRHVRRARRGRR